MIKKQIIPKIWLSYNHLLIQVYLSEFSKEDYMGFKNSKYVREVNDFIRQYGKEILKNISKFSGIKWYRKEIPIYLLPEQIKKKSFSHPLVLTSNGKNFSETIFVLAHELTHVNLLADRDQLLGTGKEKRLDIPNTEAACWLIGRLALEKAIKNTGEYQKDWDKFIDNYQHEKTKTDLVELIKSWDHQKQTFKKLLQHG